MVASTSNTIHPFGEEDSSKRRQILDGARKVFMDLGFDGASMNEIARAAGVSKGTLYVYFADKNRLFEAIVEDEALEKGKIAYNLDPRRDVETTLREFGRTDDVFREYVDSLAFERDIRRRSYSVLVASLTRLTRHDLGRQQNGFTSSAP